MKQMQNGQRRTFNHRLATVDNDIYQQNRDYPPSIRTPLKSINAIQPHQVEIGFNNLPMSSTLIFPPPPPPQHPSLSTFLEQNSFPIGTPPGFITPMPMNNVSSPPIRYSDVNRDANGVPSNLLGQQQLQIDPLGMF